MVFRSKSLRFTDRLLFEFDIIPELESIAGKLDATEYNRTGASFYLWNTKELAALILNDGKEEMGYGDDYAICAYYISLYLKCFGSDVIQEFVKNYYDTGEKNYNKVFEDKTMFERMYSSKQSYIGSLFYDALKYNKFLGTDLHIYFNPQYRHKLYKRKPSPDGLSLVECSKDEASKAAGQDHSSINRFKSDEEFHKYLHDYAEKRRKISEQIEKLKVDYENV